MGGFFEQTHPYAISRTKRGLHTLFAFALGLLLILAGISGCFGCLGSMANSGLHAQALAAAMHQRIASGDLAGIYNDADQRYRDAVSREKSDALFSAVERKLGTPEDCKQRSLNAMAATWGNSIRLVCETTFSKGATGVETFVWVKSGDQFKLVSYYINSEELIER